MNTYTVYITLTTDSKPTDLELGDLMNGLSETLQYPTIESPDGQWVRADYNITGYEIELYEETGERVWKYSANDLIDDNDLTYNDYFMNMEQFTDIKKPQEFPHSTAGLPLGWLSKFFRKKD